MLLRPNWINSKLTYIQINEKEKTCIKSIFLFNYPYGILKYKALEFKKQLHKLSLKYPCVTKLRKIWCM